MSARLRTKASIRRTLRSTPKASVVVGQSSSSAIRRIGAQKSNRRSPNITLQMPACAGTTIAARAGLVMTRPHPIWTPHKSNVNVRPLRRTALRRASNSSGWFLRRTLPGKAPLQSGAFSNRWSSGGEVFLVVEDDESVATAAQKCCLSSDITRSAARHYPL